jgi:hypothetical protein
MSAPNATRIVREALAGTGIELVASAPIEVYDARAPAPFQSSLLCPGSRGVVVVGSAGRTLWQGMRDRTAEDPELWSSEHPLDTFVAELLARADDALTKAGVRFRRFEPTIHTALPVDFRALGAMVGLGVEGPFGLLINREHGPWWALRGAWLVDAQVEPPLTPPATCEACSAPCIGGRGTLQVAEASPEVRGRCIYGQGSRYTDEQIAYHYDREPTLLALRARAVKRA